MLTSSFAVFAALFAGQTPAPDFYHDFRGGKPLPPGLSRIGPNADAVVISEAEGLRVRLPTAGKVTGGWGVALRFTFAGDFEVTGSYELLAAETPLSGVGAGVALNALPELGGRKFAKVGRFLLFEGDNVHVAEFLNRDQRQNNKWISVPTTARAGQLRLVRTGSVMHYRAADAPNGAFREIAAWEFGPEDLSMVRFIANNNGSPTAVDVRLLDLRVTGSLLPLTAAPVEMPVAAPIEKPRFPFAWIVGLIVTALLIAVGARLMLRRRGIAGQEPTSTTGDG